MLIRLVLTEIQAFKNEKNLQRNVWKCGQIRTRVRICPHFHIFLCKFFSFLNACISVKTSGLLSGFVRISIHFFVNFFRLYRLKTSVTISQFIYALTHLHNSVLIEPTTPPVLLGDFNIDIMQANTEQKALIKYLITDKGYTQMINQYTDYHTQTNHVPQIMCTISR